MSKHQAGDKISYMVDGVRKIGVIEEVATSYKILYTDGLFCEESLESADMTDDKLKLIMDTVISVLKSGRMVSIPENKLDDIHAGLIAASEIKELLVEIPANLPKALKLLGVALYHLSAGESEHNDISYLEGYITPLKSRWWPAIDKLANNKLTTIEVLEDILEKIGSEPEPMFVPGPFGEETRPAAGEFVAGQFKAATSNCFRLISDDVTLILDALDGSATLAKASDVFGHIDPDFTNWNLTERAHATKETPVAVYEIIKDGTIPQLFGSFQADLDKLCLTQAQIKNFVKKFRNHLRTLEYGTFFLFKRGDDFFIARVYVDGDGSLYVRVYRFGSGYVWDTAERHRFVAPLLEKLEK